MHVHKQDSPSLSQHGLAAVHASSTSRSLDQEPCAGPALLFFWQQLKDLLEARPCPAKILQPTQQEHA